MSIRAWRSWAAEYRAAPRTTSGPARPCPLTSGPPGTMPAASAAARYLRTVLRDKPRLAAISLFDRLSHVECRPRHRAPFPRGGIILVPDDQIHPRHHALTTVNKVIAMVNYSDRRTPPPHSFVIADKLLPLGRSSSNDPSCGVGRSGPPTGST